MAQQVGPVGPVRRAGFVGWVGVFLLGLAVVAVGVLVVRRLIVKHPVCGPETPSPDSTYVAEDSLGKGEVLAGALARWCISTDRINDVHSALAKTDFNFRNMRQGDGVVFVYHGLKLVEMSYRKDLVTSYAISFDSAGATAAKEVKPVDTVRVLSLIHI